jgi:alkylated DNA repair dioxygenase AlkB
MNDLFDDLPKPDVLWYPDWLAPQAAEHTLTQLIDEVAWKQESMGTPGGCVPLPRLTAWQGEADAVYVYSGIRNVPQTWTPTVAELRAGVEAICGCRFNSVLINRYRNGMDSMGWHADHERELGARPVIASVSLGVARTFDLRHNKTGLVQSYQLKGGYAWEHAGAVAAPGAQGAACHRRADQSDVSLGNVGALAVSAPGARRRLQARRWAAMLDARCKHTRSNVAARSGCLS